MVEYVKKTRWTAAVIGVGLLALVLVATVLAYLALSGRAHTVERGQETAPDSASLVKYSSESKGLEFSYPQNWQLIEQPDAKAGVALRSPTYAPTVSGQVTYDGEIYINSIPNPQNLSIEGLFRTFDDSSRSWFDSFQHGTLLIGGKEAVVFSNLHEEAESYSRTVMLIPCDNRVLSVSYIHEGSGVGQYDNVTRQIASTAVCR